MRPLPTVPIVGVQSSGLDCREWSAEVDELLAPLLTMREPLTDSGFEAVTAAHGRLLALLAGVCASGKTPRSFAAKYLRLHVPVALIYDEYARAALTRLVHWDKDVVPFPQPQGADAEYWQFCVRFARFYAACRTAELRVTVKSLDQYLWTLRG
jgi:hypothetical protein